MMSTFLVGLRVQLITVLKIQTTSYYNTYFFHYQHILGDFNQDSNVRQKMGSIVSGDGLLCTDTTFVKCFKYFRKNIKFQKLPGSNKRIQSMRKFIFTKVSKLFPMLPNMVRSFLKLFGSVDLSEQ